MPVDAGAAADRMDRRTACIAARAHRHPSIRRPTLSGLSGAPEARGGVKISISHTERLAVALATAQQVYAIGVDVEAISTDTRGEELLAERILSAAERDGSVDGTSIETVRRLSIKEAGYKAISSLTGKHLPLREISVERDGDTGFSIRVPVRTCKWRRSPRASQGTI